ncbi:patatin-like phospholipase family protein [Pseudoxanthomonas suwonensis]|uniref:PNPLA domain-containing protein n=1 Tax=Pseudoxanthomonas suwonensis TaxID=314722 RepID=A0A0E3Z5G4_9GAMM|nr:patatin-like phospholipase family protein [Pseudoxanthomonas suwonensis]AKC88042.1 hypothetical protein WQ53_15970 [Pseudoxanthomonas suwonensis]
MSRSASPVRRLVHALIPIAFAASLAGCITIPRHPVPAGATASAMLPGMPEVRGWAGSHSDALERDFILSLQQESPEDFPVGADGVIRYPYLAISGGGANGAFGAGFLNGWTTTGTRPVFKVVTGVSTGALMAPFVFLGPRYDPVLHRFYTTTRSQDVFEAGSPLMALLRRDSLAQTAPLASLIAQQVDMALLQEVAEAHRQGRRLYMGTVDLDSRDFVVWNMGLIAERGDDAALELFRKVMLASSSIPIAFPPVMFDVEVGGQRYDEMHVDGFVGANVFLNAGVFDPLPLYGRAGRAPGREDIFIVHNGQLHAPPSPTPRSLRGIAARVIETTGRASIIGDLFREYAFAQRNRSGFHWVTIDESVELPDPIAFDTEKMAELYDIGYRAAAAGPAWLEEPPGLRPATSPE